MPRLLALDIGTRHTGVAYVDTDNGIPLPLDTIEHRTKEQLCDAVKKIRDARSIDTILIGLPLLPSGEEGTQTSIVREYGALLEALGTPLLYKDERYTTPRRTSGERKERVLPQAEDDNAAAATQILTTYLGY